MNEYPQAGQELNADKASFSLLPNLIVHPRTFYIICGTSHSGISHLCEALGNTQLAGKPAEYFTSPQDLLFAEQWEIPLHNDPPDHFDEAYIQRAFAAGTTPNGIFGVKALWPDIPYCLQSSLIDMFSPCQYIMIMRRDKVRQAIAWWQDLKIAQWHRQHGNSKEDGPQPVFNFGAIEAIRQLITNYERSMLRFFSLNDIQSFIVVYEDVVTSYEKTLLQILSYLHIPVPDNLVPGERIVPKQADDLTEEWVRQYHHINDEQEKTYTNWSLNVRSTNLRTEMVP